MEQALFVKKGQQHLSGDLQFQFCGLSRTLPYHSFGPAIRECFVLHVVLEGKGTYHVKDQKYQLKKGDLFLIRPGVTTFYRADAEEPWMYGWLAFSGKTGKEVISHSAFGEEGFAMISSNTQQYIEIIKECLKYSQDNLLNELHLNQQAYRFLATLLEDGGKVNTASEELSSPLALATVDYIQQHYAEKITVEVIAQQLSVNRSHLSRVFSKQMDMGIKEYLNGVRTNRAAFMLAYTQESVEEIANQVGFNSLVVFSRTFKKSTGETPTEYRSRMRQSADTSQPFADVEERLKLQAVVPRAT
ncbi:AraC family transcriptional regulator [Enterococcus sp. 669A]|uniref:AraC family transcriptional regulator n=1 Tax=Candidatus Enterococcus moelleringii TaxID=2815325 RepID=A0ABS3LGM4_9ENTE|nr:AraC family transcriptional regulator [Enterococcus sp. 669A]MBO1308780.1 AraC family transcriptional regulator [Enterococcus sp. 669A]